MNMYIIVRLFILTSTMLLVLSRTQTSDDLIQLNGIGATFPVEVYGGWRAMYEHHRRGNRKVNMKYVDFSSLGGKRGMMYGYSGEPVQYGGSDAVLLDWEYQLNPHLQMVPVVAGGVALAFNIPGITHLVLTRPHIVGIYNGTYTWWNDTTFHELNPNITLPQKKIKVIARADYSGTTEIFTHALSSFDPNWNNSIGTFADGLLPNGSNHSKWDIRVVKHFGRTNRGMVGILFSIRYSIAYMSIAEVKVANLTHVSIINRAGRVVRVDAEVTNNVIEREACPNFGSELTASIVDSELDDAYPILGLSYFVVRRHGMERCLSAIELVRYLEWLYTDSLAKRAAAYVYMTPMPRCVADLVSEELLKKMTCGPEQLNVYDLVRAQRASEKAWESWRLPVYISVPLSFTFLCVVVGYMVYQQIMINKAVMSDDWKIPCKDIVIHWDRTRGWMGSRKTLSMQFGSSLTGAASLGSDVSVNIRGLAVYITMMGTWHHRKVSLRKIESFSPDSWRPIAKTLVQMKYKISDANIIRFYGVTFFDDVSYLVAEHSEKGCLRDVLQNTKYTIDDNFKFAMAWDIASGMDYLHRNGIIHGGLNIDCCLLDGQWTIKISNWEYQYVESQTIKKKNSSAISGLSDIHNISGVDPVTLARRQLWLAPELLRNNSRAPDKKSDVYSFSMVLVEIFTREDPYSEYTTSGRLDPLEIIEKLKAGDICPDIKHLVPEEVYLIAQSAWSDNPNLRPAFGQILKTIDATRESNRTVLESMMYTLESYAGQLEEMVEERTSELAAVNTSLQDLLHQMLPKSVANSLQGGRPVEPEHFDSVTIFFSQIADFNEITASSSPMEIVILLNKLYTAFDKVIESLDVYKVETIGDSYMCISGLPVRNGIQHAGNIADMALLLMETAGRLTVANRPEDNIVLRAGIHSGPVVAGVVGRKTPRYCLFGDTVNTASRMETTSLPKCIQISPATHALLSQLGKYTMELRGCVEVKGKGRLTTFFLLTKESDDQGKNALEII